MNEDAQAKWNRWAQEHPDLLSSVERGPDLEQTRWVARDVTAKLELGPEDDLLDVGCGSGLLLSLLRPKCRSAIGVDFSPEQVALGRRHLPDLSLAVGSAEQLGFRDGRFSRLLCYSAWHYVDDWRRTLDGFLRVLRRPGILLIGDIPSVHHKWRLYLKYALLLPVLLLFRPKLFVEKLTVAQDATPWHWVNLRQIRAYLESRGCTVEILKQPRGHRQHGGMTDLCRFDLKARVPREHSSWPKIFGYDPGFPAGGKP